MARTDQAITPALLALHNCATQQLAAIERPVMRFPISFGDAAPPADACDCDGPNSHHGQGWIRWADVSTAGTSPAVAGCGPALLQVTIALGVYRCAPFPADGDAVIDEQIETEHALGMMRDAYALRAAVACCGFFDEHDVTPVIQSQTPLGPLGGCVGVETRVSFTSSDCACGSGAQ